LKASCFRQVGYFHTFLTKLHSKLRCYLWKAGGGLLVSATDVWLCCILAFLNNVSSVSVPDEDPNLWFGSTPSIKKMTVYM
jgi:hypothetical protein